MNEKKKYIHMDPVIDYINKHVVSLHDQEIKRNNEILRQFLDAIIPKMKQKNSLFSSLFQRVFHGGSFYDGLRVEEPSEFDLDLLLSLPKLADPQVSISENPGFVEVKLTGINKLMTSDLAQRFKGLDKLIDMDTLNLSTYKVLRWMESILMQTLNDFSTKNGYFFIDTSYGKLTAKMHKNGPAFTVAAKGSDTHGNQIILDIDLVPCFVFSSDKWPKYPFRENPEQSKPDYFIVPKLLKVDVTTFEYCWRLSFQEQERVIIDKKEALKPAIKILKRMRDRLGHAKIASYYIKTVALWEVYERDDNNFWRYPKSFVFMTLLKAYYKFLNDRNIPYFWNKDNNLIGHITEITLSNIANRIKAVIYDIETHPDNPFVVAKYVLNPGEYADLIAEMNQDDSVGTPQIIEPEPTMDSTNNIFSCQIL